MSQSHLMSKNNYQEIIQLILLFTAAFVETSKFSSSVDQIFFLCSAKQIYPLASLFSVKNVLNSSHQGLSIEERVFFH